MARPRKFDEEQVAEALLQTFWSLGYAATSLPQLKTATGLGAGSLYAAFGSKEAMFDLAVQRYRGYLAAAFRTEKTGLQGIKYLLDKVVSITAADPQRRGCLMINAIPESKALSQKIQLDLKKGLDEFRNLLRQHLQGVFAQATKPDKKLIDQLAANLAASAIGIRVLGRAGASRQQLQAVADGGVLLVSGLLD